MKRKRKNPQSSTQQPSVTTTLKGVAALAAPLVLMGLMVWDDRK